MIIFENRAVKALLLDNPYTQREYILIADKWDKIIVESNKLRRFCVQNLIM